MVKNNHGFTMIELLAAIVVLGILMGTGVPVVINIMNDQKNEIYITDALRLAANMDNKLRSDNMLDIPARGGCIAINLVYMDNNSFGKSPYGGEYDRDASFVIAKRLPKDSEEEYAFYVRLVEKTKAGSFRGVDLAEYNKLYERDAKKKYTKNIDSPLQLSSYEEDGSKYSVLLEEYEIACLNTIFVAPDENY